MSGNFPYSIVDMEPSVNQQLLEDFTGESKGWLQVGPKKFALPARYQEYADQFYNLKLRPDDVWIVTFPRSGTTMTQDMIWLLRNQFDFKKCKELTLAQRFPQLELFTRFGEPLISKLQEELRGTPLEALSLTIAENIVPKLDAWPGQRHIKSHLPLSLLPPKLLDTCKVVYLCRNPKDVSVSFYHTSRMMPTNGYKGDFAKFWDYFEKGHLRWGPYWAHIEDAWQHREHPNMLLLFYEDIIRDKESAVRKMADFLGVEMSEEQLAGTLDHLDIKNFKKNTSVNMQTWAPVMAKDQPGNEFIRKGENNDWQTTFTPELAARADRWIEENLKRIPDLAFPKP